MAVEQDLAVCVWHLCVCSSTGPNVMDAGQSASTTLRLTLPHSLPRLPPHLNTASEAELAKTASKGSVTCLDL